MRTVHSFVRRQGRLTAAQKSALDRLSIELGLTQGTDKLDFSGLFDNTNPVVLEIGFGNGESLASMATQQPQNNFVGVEVHTPGVGNLLRLVEENQLRNVRVACVDVVDLLEHRVPEQSLSRVQIFFPDPWHKKRHHKRRIIQPEFADLLASRLTLNGCVHLATDWHDYALQMLEVFSNHPQFINQATAGESLPSPYQREQTRFERRGLSLGHEIRDFIFKRK